MFKNIASNWLLMLINVGVTYIVLPFSLRMLGQEQYGVWLLVTSMTVLHYNYRRPRMSWTDALYFTVTVFTTVGFGDIAAKSEGARILVTAQMIVDLLILGIGAKVILGAVTRGRQRQPAPAA